MSWRTVAGAGYKNESKHRLAISRRIFIQNAHLSGRIDEMTVAHPIKQAAVHKNEASNSTRHYNASLTTASADPERVQHELITRCVDGQSSGDSSCHGEQSLLAARRANSNTDLTIAHSIFIQKT